MPTPHLSLSPDSSAPVLALPTVPPGFAWTRHVESGGSISLVLAGELDLATREPFEAALADAQAKSDRVVLDLRALTLIDCASLFVIHAAAARSRREHAVMILLSPRGQVRRVLDLLGAPPGAAILEHHELPGADRKVAA
jgi:anti-anti-sigma factor